MKKTTKTVTRKSKKTSLKKTRKASSKVSKKKLQLNSKSNAKPKSQSPSQSPLKAKPEARNWETTERALTQNLSADLLEAWEKIRAYSVDLGEQRIYASGKAIMFSKKTCFFFVRPKKSYLEVVIFLADAEKRSGFHTVVPVSKIKFAHTFKLVHADQVEGVLTDAIDASFARALGEA